MTHFKKYSFNHYATIALIWIGLLQPIGYLFNLPQVQRIGIAFVASPLPLVFSHFRGLETFSSQFHIALVISNHETIQITLTPKNYFLLKGPYNRRSAYGTTIAYSPQFMQGNEFELVQSILIYGFCKGALLSSLGIYETIQKAKIQVINYSNKDPINFIMEVKCN